MNKRTNKPEWHEPGEAIGSEVDDPIEDSVEVGSVALIDGPLDPVPLDAGPRDIETYQSVRRSVGPLPKLTKGDDMEDAAKSAVGTALDTVKSVAGNAGSVTKSAITSAASVVGTAGASGAKTAGTVLWEIIQRNPLQAIAVIASVIWLLRNNQAAASQPVVTLPQVGEKVGTVAGQVQIAATNLGGQIGDQAHRAQGWFGRTLHETPLALGAFAIVLGAAIGFSVPETPQENQWMGATRDKLAAQAQEAAQDLTQKVTTVAQTAVHEAVETVKEEAKNQGLTV